MRNLLFSLFLLALPCLLWAERPPVRGYMSHRGVHLRSTIAGENSLQSVDLAYRAGFWCIETDTRYTKDSVLVIMHDAAINRTCTYADGSPIEEKILVENLGFDQLRRDFRLKATREEDRVQVPTLKEFLQHCKKYGFLVFIEPKLNDATGRYYLDIIREADEALGREGYVITSNNFANEVIRNTLGISDVRLMGLLYKTDYETMSGLGNVIFAVSSTALSPDDFHSYVRRANADGYWVQSAAGLLSRDADDDFHSFNMIGEEGKKVHIISTDEIAPDAGKAGQIVARFRTKSPSDIEKKLSKLPVFEFSGLYVGFRCEGSADLVIGTDRIRIDSSGKPFCGSYQRMVFDSRPFISFENVSSDFNLLGCEIKIIKF